MIFPEPCISRSGTLQIRSQGWAVHVEGCQVWKEGMWWKKPICPMRAEERMREWEVMPSSLPSGRLLLLAEAGFASSFLKSACPASPIQIPARGIIIDKCLPLLHWEHMKGVAISSSEFYHLDSFSGSFSDPFLEKQWLSDLSCLIC